jgi:hypothetical protein
MRGFITHFFCLLGCSLSITTAVADTTEVNLILRNTHEKQVQLTRNGMISLNTWAGVNLIGSGIGWGLTNGQQKYFHQMNVMWNVVNVGIAIPGLLGTKKLARESVTFSKVAQRQNKLENVYLFNAGLDVGYMATGWALFNFGNTKTGEMRLRFRGYGQSLVLQGGYLFVYDMIMFALLKRTGKALKPLWNNVQVAPYGLGMSVRVRL